VSKQAAGRFADLFKKLEEGDEKPPGESDKPPAEGDKPPAEGAKPPAEGAKPPTEGAKPPAEGSKPPAEGGKPPAEEVQAILSLFETQKHWDGCQEVFSKDHKEFGGLKDAILKFLGPEMVDTCTETLKGSGIAYDGGDLGPPPPPPGQPLPGEPETEAEKYTDEEVFVHVSLPTPNTPLGLDVARHECDGLVGPLFVSKVDPYSPAGLARIPEGAVLTSVDGQSITDLASLQHAIADARMNHPGGEPFAVGYIKTLTPKGTRPLSGMHEALSRRAGPVMSTRAPAPTEYVAALIPEREVSEGPSLPELPVPELSVASTPCPDGYVKVPRRLVLQALERRMREEKERAAKNRRPSDSFLRHAPRAAGRGQRPHLPFRGIGTPAEAAALARQMLLADQLDTGKVRDDERSPERALRTAESVIRRTQRRGLHMHLDTLQEGKKVGQQPVVGCLELKRVAPEVQWAGLREQMAELQQKHDYIADRRNRELIDGRRECDCIGKLEKARNAMLGYADTDSDEHRRSFREVIQSQYDQPPWAMKGQQVVMWAGENEELGTIEDFNTATGECTVLWDDPDVMLDNVQPLSMLRPPVDPRSIGGVVDALNRALEARDASGVNRAALRIRTQEDWKALQPYYDGNLLAEITKSLGQAASDKVKIQLKRRGIRTESIEDVVAALKKALEARDVSGVNRAALLVREQEDWRMLQPHFAGSLLGEIAESLGQAVSDKVEMQLRRRGIDTDLLSHEEPEDEELPPQDEELPPEDEESPPPQDGEFPDGPSPSEPPDQATPGPLSIPAAFL